MSSGDSQRTPKKLRQLSITDLFGSFARKRKISSPDQNSCSKKSSNIPDTVNLCNEAGESNFGMELNKNTAIEDDGNQKENSNRRPMDLKDGGTQAESETDGSSQDKELLELIMAEKREANERLLKKEFVDDIDLSLPTPVPKQNVDPKQKPIEPEPDKLTMYDSPDLFDTYPTPDFDDASNPEEDVPVNWMGMPKSRLKIAPDCLLPLPDLKANESHTVLFDTSYFDFGPPPPSKKTYIDAWDPNHVKLPCSPKNLFPVTEGKESRLTNRWELIENSLLSGIKSSQQLEAVIKKYNVKFTQPFSALHSLINDKFGPTERENFFSVTLPGMIELALSLPALITQPVPLLKTQRGHCLTLSQQQIACLLCNAFFCTFPRRNATNSSSEYGSYPTINFNRLFCAPSSSDRRDAHVEKLKTVLHYFETIINEMPSGVVTFERRVCEDFPLWNKSPNELRSLHIRRTGLIEDEGKGMLQMDFANKFIGGGVLGSGLVQEEILFIIYPELLVSRLFMEVMDENECVIITGAQRFSKYSGYSNEYKWEGPYLDTNSRDSWRRKVSFIVALDATPSRKYENQFQVGNVRRELNKLYCGFHGALDPDYAPAIATGNWGCGAFGGDVILKALLQMMTAAVVCRDLCYMTHDDEKLMETLHDMHRFITVANLTVGDLWNLICQYNKEEVMMASKQKRPVVENIFEFMLHEFMNSCKDS